MHCYGYSYGGGSPSTLPAISMALHMGEARPRSYQPAFFSIEISSRRFWGRRPYNFKGGTKDGGTAGTPQDIPLGELS